ncbi:hypothetical protein, partial [Chromobacterium haemolyticum]|uniref:hypothetical protein n=1 Tax=Chromobacterium haemolyticum TaxID=394935 RepID=UPI001F082039
GKPGPIEDVSVLIDNIDREVAALQREEGHAERIAELEAQRAELQADLEKLHAAWDEQQSWWRKSTNSNSSGPRPSRP